MPILDTTKDLSALFRQQVQATPDLVALEDDAATYTYAELDRKVEALSHRLRQHRVGRDSLVGVLLPRSADYVIACLAALRAGGAFLVLELAYPPELLADVLDDAKPAVVITCRSETGKIEDGVSLIVVDEAEAQTNGHANGEAADLPPMPADDDLDRLAFVAYSSGTTGKPKGIANPHRAPVLSYDLRFGVRDLQPGDRVACNVFFVWEILRPLLRGATVVCVPDETSYDPPALVDFMSSKKVTETLMTPTLLAAVLSRHPKIGSRLPDLRTLWLNGEVVTTDLARRALKALPRVALLNCYSACETHEIACGDIGQMLENDANYCPVGPPLDPEHTYILNETGQKVEPGTSGELFVGGQLLARGYINRPETTAQAFTPDPFDSRPGARMYRTGDGARLLPSGVLEITGRVGSMIKLRGYSVIPGKVENEIIQHLAVSHCAVVAHGDGIERQLVAYIVRDQDVSSERPVLEIDEVGHSPAARKTLSPYLAHYMIPSLWVQVDELPTHAVSGKVDLKNLPSPPKAKAVNGDLPIQTNGHSKGDADPITSEAVAEIWASTLKISRNSIQPEHSFFDLGGHSLTLADLSARISRILGVKIPIARLVDPATLNGHLETIRSVRDGHTAEVQAHLPDVLRKDSVLDESIKSSNTEIIPANKADTILLTGVTGFLGPFLLNDILENTSAKILCLVRFTDPSEADLPAGIARLRRQLLDLGLWHDSIMERVEILPGNMSRPRLGLSPDAFEELARRVQVIFHAAASVNLVYPYAALRDANVGGTREILRLASRAGATVQYISTNGVLPPSQYGWRENSMLEVNAVPEKLTDGYGQTKWVAEKLVQEAGTRGIPVKIHRLGTISGHSATGAANVSDLLNAIIVESIRLGYCPDVAGWRMEMTPVDFVSKAIVHLANQSQTSHSVFHLGDPDPAYAPSIFRDLQELGYPTEPLAWDDWVAMWNEKRGVLRGGDGAFTIDILRSGMPDVEFLRGVVVLDNAVTRPLRADVQRPKVDIVLLETYTRHWFARGWLLHPPTRQHALGGAAALPRRGPLTGKVAVITGASSGIGAAVASALVREGAHVALGARRIDALEAIKRKLVVRDSKIVIRKTDVTDKRQVEDLVRAANEELGPVDILVSCAGVMYWTLMTNAHVDDWDRTVDVNCKGLLHCLASTVPSMVSRGSGHVVAISSDAGRKVFPGLGVYSASKFFVEATLQSLRLETAGTGLRVTSVQPGNTQTDLLTMSTDAEAVKKYGEPSGAQILDPEDIANSIVYALRQPSHVAVNEVLIEPREEPI
jgi:amino acid adenylation domain-containing protein/thioester reductase-like protein